MRHIIVKRAKEGRLCYNNQEEPIKYDSTGVSENENDTTLFVLIFVCIKFLAATMNFFRAYKFSGNGKKVFFEPINFRTWKIFVNLKFKVIPADRNMTNFER